MKFFNSKDIANAYDGIGFQKLFWIFIIAAFAGNIIEIFYCRIVDGVWMGRSSFMYGQLTAVWGVGAVLLTLIMLPVSKRGLFLVFIIGFIIGGIYEYTCSYITERIYGAVFWDYSNMKFNIGGRTNLMFCFAWGILGVVWIQFLYPAISALIDKLPDKTINVATIVMATLLVLDTIITFAVVSRYSKRQAETKLPDNAIVAFIDEKYPDEVVEERWPNLLVKQKNDKSGEE